MKAEKQVGDKLLCRKNLINTWSKLGTMVAHTFREVFSIRLDILLDRRD